MSLQETADRLDRILGPLRRVLGRYIRRTGEVTDVSESQVELLRALPEHGTIGPRLVAERMRVAPSTVSNLVKGLAQAGLVERVSNPDDFRAVGLSLTPASREILDRYNQLGSTALARALQQLSAREQQALQRALPVLEKLVAVLEAENGA
ncbi:putative MarR family transcriptional regulator [Nocardia brasiliensis NBRC 14402]|uniref:MarR family winged helix-turn-helix transcriptional regulator n=1 Tax=Nocardia brasiliensis TaxID=37326 RepID=UPI0003105DC5|nr:MarR family transcriptional regulator [Nocardia brasiliensis]GAJ86299.1 putative MarR family transcriptional regulator [Nocardia brasiliensis NBRC 14402]SUB47741.1 Uncharacterized HTH-type transcriptional regulator yusO [Nocardia brasiliensis]